MGASDTTPDAEAVQRSVYRSMTGPERVALALSLAEEARRLSLEGIAQRHPELDGHAVQFRLLEMLHGPAVAAAVARLQA